MSQGQAFKYQGQGQELVKVRASVAKKETKANNDQNIGMCRANIVAQPFSRNC